MGKLQKGDEGTFKGECAIWTGYNEQLEEEATGKLLVWFPEHELAKFIIPIRAEDFKLNKHQGDRGVNLECLKKLGY